LIFAFWSKTLGVSYGQIRALIIFAYFGIGGKKPKVATRSVLSTPMGYIVVAPAEAPPAKQNSGYSTLLMFWGLFTIFLFVLMFN